VVEDFLRLARPQSVVMGSCDLAEELSNVITLVSAEAKNRDVLLELDASLMPVIEGDREKLRQAFLNLILNALQATPAGGRVTITAKKVESHDDEPAGVEICFADTGTGIPAEALDSIYEPFFTTKEGGTGLGLAITRKIIEGHRGRIEVESEPGRGTTFRVRLPDYLKPPEGLTGDNKHSCNA